MRAHVTLLLLLLAAPVSAFAQNNSCRFLCDRLCGLRKGVKLLGSHVSRDRVGAANDSRQTSYDRPIEAASRKVDEAVTSRT